MTYNSIWFVFLWVFVILFIISLLLVRYKSIKILLPYTWSFSIFSLLQKIISFVILILIVIIPFNIWIYQWTNVKKVATLNIEILFDVSLSMVAKDFDPDRFHVARNSLINFINSLDVNYNIWVIAFSWKPFIYIPISDNKKAIISKLNNMSMADFPPTLDFVWTAIGDAILLWKKQLIKFTKKSKNPWAIILITDWDSNKWTSIDVSLDFAKSKNIPIFVWAIWTAKKYVVWEDKYNSIVDTSMNLKLLEDIAKKTWWEFQQLKTKEDFLEILSKLYSYVKEYEQLQKIEIYSYINYYLKIALIFLLVVYMIMFSRFSLNFNK